MLCTQISMQVIPISVLLATLRMMHVGRWPLQWGFRIKVGSHIPASTVGAPLFHGVRLERGWKSSIKS